jgi:anti-sigma regulatory factor (Ser/Thr protein kinase)
VADNEPAEPGARALRLTGHVSDLAPVRAFVRDAVVAYGGSGQAATDLVQAVDEAACNVLLHGYGGKAGELAVETALRDGRIEVRILDRAPEYDPTAAADRDITGPPTSAPRPGGMGMGIHLLRTMMDEVHHSVRPGGGNELLLIRSIDERKED